MALFNGWFLKKANPDAERNHLNKILQEIREDGLVSYTVATVPSAATSGRLIFVSDETGGAVPAFSDGTNWRRVTDRAIVS